MKAETTVGPAVPSAEAGAAPRGRRRLWLGFLVGLLLLPPNSLWVLYMESISGRGPFVSTISLFFNVVFLVVLVALANALVRRVAPRLALNRAELVIVYVLLVFGTSIAGHDTMQVFLPIIAVGSWFATPQNRWEEMLAGTTPPWTVISDRQVLYGFWNGGATLYDRAVLQAWVTPALWWAALFLLMGLVLLGLSVLLRPLWSDRERLTFPIIQLPLELTDPDTRLLRNRLLWIGFAAAAALDLLNGLNAIFPSVPALPVNIDLGAHLTDRPWSGIGWLPVTFYPAVIGLSFLMPLELLFSCVAFFLWWKVMFLLAAATGVSEGYYADSSVPVFPYSQQQMLGSYLAVAVASPLLGRRYFRSVWTRIRGGASEVDDSGEAMRFRTALLCVIVGFALLVAMSVAGGMSLALAVAFFVVYFLLAIAVARIRAEFGSPVHDFHAAGPEHTLPQVLGTMNLGQHDLGMLTQYFGFNRAYRGHLAAGTMEALQMSARTGTPPRAAAAAVVVGILLGVFAGMWLWLHFSYTLGLGSGWAGGGWFGREAYGRLESWIQDPKPANFAVPVAMAAGFAITLALAAARATFVTWPLHPVAYALSASWSIHLVWTPMLIAWIVKSLVLRYGGLRLYRQVLPLFYGLIFGESIVGCSWSLIGLAFRVPSYNFFGG